MICKVFKANNSLVISLPNEVLSQLNLAEGSQISMCVDEENNQIILEPAQTNEVAGIDSKFAQ